MKPLPFTWPYAVVFWLVMAWAFTPEFGVIRRARHTGNTTDARSLQLIMVGMNLAFFAGFFIAWLPVLRISPSIVVAMFWMGIALMISGSLLRRHCFRMLGESFTGDVRASPDQQVITRGAYSLLRHPSYSAGILMNAGTGFALGSWGSVLLITAITFAVYAYRISVEERALLAAIGEPYRAFMSTRKRLVPFVY